MRKNPVKTGSTPVVLLCSFTNPFKCFTNPEFKLKRFRSSELKQRLLTHFWLFRTLFMFIFYIQPNVINIWNGKNCNKQRVTSLLSHQKIVFVELINKFWGSDIIRLSIESAHSIIDGLESNRTFIFVKMDGPDQLTKTRRCGSQRGQPISLKVDDLKVPKFSKDRPYFVSFNIPDRPLQVFPIVHFTLCSSLVRC